MKARNKYSQRIQVLAPDIKDGRTQEHFKDQVDINRIVKKYKTTGIVDHVARARLRFGDLRDLNLYAEDLDKVAKAQQAFEMLPAELRNEFKNNIPDFFNYLNDPKNDEQLIKWGLVDKPKVSDMPVAPPSDISVPAGSKKSGAPKKTPVISEE